MSRSAVSEWVGRLRVCWEMLDAEAIGDLFTDDVVYETSPFRAALVGRAAVSRHWRSELDGVTSVDVGFGSPLVDAARAVVTWRAKVSRGRRVVEEAGVLLIEVRDRSCSHLAEYWMIEPDVPPAVS